MTTDTIADMLTRIRNANSAHHEEVRVPHSKVKEGIANVLKDEGYIESFEVIEIENAPSASLRISLKPKTPQGKALSGLRRISRPGLRVYVRKNEIPRVLGGLGISVISTSRGLMTGSSAQRAGLGGEVVAYVW